MAVVVVSPIFSTLSPGPGEGDGVRPVEVGNEGVGRIRRVRYGNASLVQLVRGAQRFNCNNQPRCRKIQKDGGSSGGGVLFLLLAHLPCD